MYEDDEEIYDDTGDTGDDMSESTGLSAIKARFEQAQNKFESPSPGPKPGVTPKPKPLPKYGGGGGLNICGVADKKDGSTIVEKKDGGIPNSLKPKSAIKQENDFVSRDKTSDISSGGPMKKRDSKVNIPEAFRQKTEESPVEIKPKPSIKPNKWASDSNNNAKVNGVASAKNIEIIENALAHKKPLVAKHADSENTAAGKVSPREKSTDSSIPKSQSDSSKPKTSPRGVGTGIDVLAKVAKLAGDSKGPIDFKSKLRHVDQKKNSPSSVPLSPKKVEIHNDSTDSKDVPWRRNLKSAKFRERTKSIRSVIRVFDGKKFLRVDDTSLGDDSPPEKPEKLDCDIDIEALEAEFKEAIENIVVTEKEQHGWTEVEEVYDDCGNLQPVSSRTVSLMGNRPKPKPRKSKKVPLIEPMTEDEELNETHWNEAGFEGLPESTDELPAPPPELLEQETYDDVAVAEAVPPEEEDLEQDEMYEELPDEPVPESPPPSLGPKPSAKPPELPSTPLPKTPIERSDSENKSVSEQTPDAKEQKRLEKERKKKEKEEKKLLENKEKELKKLLKVLGHKVTAEVLTTSVGKGKVKSNAKGKEKTGDLTVTEGDQVDIIRMIDNPAGKWLVRVLSSQKDKERSHEPYSPLELIGYCDEKNIEFMTGSGGQKSSTSAASLEEDQETYEAVDGEEDLVEDEIYEECN